MKVFAIQKTQANTFVPQFKQNDSGTTKTNPAGDTFVSRKVSFGMASINDIKAAIVELSNQLNTKKLSQAARMDLQNRISRLELKLQRRTPSDGDGISPSAAQRAVDNYMP